MEVDSISKMVEMEEVKSPKSSTTDQLPFSSPTRWGCEEYILFISYVIGMSVRYLPAEDIDGYPIPTIIFKGQPKTYQTFLLGIVGAFSFSIATIYIRQPTPKLAAYVRRFAIFSMASSLSLALWAAGPAHWILPLYN